jgi:hypothetical protein
MCEPIPNQPFTLLSPFYHVWADFWLELGEKVLPIHGYKYTMNHGITVVLPMGAPDVQPFLDYIKHSDQWLVEPQGSSLLDEKFFVGHWTAISISLKQPKEPLMRAPLIRKEKKGFPI